MTQVPIVVGGIGGSGTRVVVELLEACGVSMGPTSMTTRDNLWFLHLVTIPAIARRPESFAQLEAYIETSPGLTIFEKAMTHIRLNAAERSVATGCFAPILSRERTCDAYQLLLHERPQSAEVWGWKDPNTHIMLPVLHRRFPAMRYIHLLRHGVDMAFSTNKNQVRSWGHLFDIHGHRWRVPFVEWSTEPTPAEALQYWIAATRRVLALGREVLSGRFLLLRFEALCARPLEAIQQLVNFVGLEISPDKLVSLAKIPQQPLSAGRHAREDLSQFSRVALEQVCVLGYTIGFP